MQNTSAGTTRSGPLRAYAASPYRHMHDKMTVQTVPHDHGAFDRPLPKTLPSGR